ncbi:MerR family transcriptional regulator [Priestia flexa]|uniref:MerR family transcriptional regulator n=1 Tax=Priestia flexa TaxID=86664 RepID=UPI000C2310A1|nr:MerR family transcriptional regulator [Priestia flexa]MEC0666617.1 MerR family transcriptional regulator [Priestia flexa]MED3823875.1 MerR family transcriptional regulator [Priestia flexa]
MTEIYTIKAVCDRLDIDRRTLKGWESSLQGYLYIERRDGARVYTEDKIELLSDINQLFAENCTLDEVKEYIQLVSQETQTVYEEAAPTVDEVSSAETNEDVESKSLEKPEDRIEEIDEKKTHPPIEEPITEEKANVSNEELLNKQSHLHANESEPVSSNDVIVQEREILQGELVEAVRRYEDVFEVLNSFKDDLLKEMREGMRNEVREEIVGEVKKELEKSANQTYEMVETVGAVISESSERNAKEVENMSKKIIRANERALDEISSIMDEQSHTAEQSAEEMKLYMKDIVANADESSKEMQYLLDRFSSNSTVAMNQVKFMVEKLSNSSSHTTEELRDLIDSMNEERVYYLKEMEKERKLHRQNVSEREEMFNDFVQTFRQTAAADMKRKRKWWKLFLS